MVKKNSSTFSFKIPHAFTAAAVICGFLFLTETILPLNAFTHRSWEALIVHTFHGILPGPFYPNQKLSMQEQGDLAPYTRFAVSKKVTWETDRYGYRKMDSEKRDYEIVMVGDSTTIGTGLDQTDMISEKLGALINTPIYPFAPYYEMDTYLKSDFYKNHPPKKVIFSMMEWALPDLIEAEPPKSSLKENPVTILTGPAVLLDRISKMSAMRFLTARLKGFIKNKAAAPSFQTIQTKDGWMIFPGGKSAHNEISLEKVQKIVSVLKRYQEELRKKNIVMYFVPVPNKESFYYKLIPGRTVPIFYLTLAEAAREAGIPTLNLLEFYANDRVNSQILLYHLDDSHWNRYGVEIAADGIAQMIEGPKKSPRERTAV